MASIEVTSNPGAMLILFFLTFSHIQSLGGHTRKGYGGGGVEDGVGGWGPAFKVPSFKPNQSFSPRDMGIM